MDPLRVAVRTYTLSISLSLLPALVPTLFSPKARSARRIWEILKRELGPTGFAFSMTLAIAGGRAIDVICKARSQGNKSHGTVPTGSRYSPRQLTAEEQTFLSNLLSSSIAALLLTSNHYSKSLSTAPIPYTVPTSRPGSPTLDLTLMLLVRALDARVQSMLRSSNIHKEEDTSSEAKAAERKGIVQRITTNLDAVLFWLACSRIMWCFFYQPERLPKSYVKWITSLADMDSRLITALQGLRNGTWKYGSPSLKHDLLKSMATDLKLDSRLGDPKYLPVHGGTEANEIWSKMGLIGRQGVGGIPCDIVHCGIAGNSCVGNALQRGLNSFRRGILIYAPVHLLPPLLLNPRRLWSNPIPVLLSLLRSATFLSTFVSSFWFTVCIVRTLVVARLFPRISHNFFDGPRGCVLAGCFVCGVSIVIERGHRRGEMALYVLPRAIRACLPERLVSAKSFTARTIERLVFALSLAFILTTAVHQPEVLRGLSRWTLAYIMTGKNTRYQGQKLASSKDTEVVRSGDERTKK